jgi:fatty acid-binding protein DegV
MAAGFALVADGAAELTREWAAKHQVEVVPYSLGGPEMVSQPSVASYVATFERLAAEGYTQALCICAASNLSGSYTNAARGAHEVEGRLEVHLIDSFGLVAAENLLARACVRGRDAGLDAHACAAYARTVAKHVRMYIVTSPVALVLNDVRHGVMGKLRARAARWSGEYAMVEIANGQVTELDHNPDVRVLSGRIVRHMSRDAAREGAMVYVELSAGDQALLTPLEKSLNTNEFEKVCAAAGVTGELGAALTSSSTLFLAYVPQAVWAQVPVA